jgi:uncharacterized protein YlzI (FlbEa/FlbD family)
MTKFLQVTGLTTEKPIFINVAQIVFVVDDEDGDTCIQMSAGGHIVCKETVNQVMNYIGWAQE